MTSDEPEMSPQERAEYEAWLQQRTEEALAEQTGPGGKRMPWYARVLYCVLCWLGELLESAGKKMA
jgi:hypothetical protein